jgi:regulator of protease activity HflC (stomatin/prohibitin superfamily)
MSYFTMTFVVILLVLLKMIRIVHMREVCVVERLGKFRLVLQPGLHILIPLVDRIAYTHETREQVLDVPPQSCISKDNIQIQVDGLVYLKVMDGHKASYGIEDYRRASVNLAQTTMRSEIGKLNLSQTFSERDTLNENIVKEIDNASDPWGIKVLRYEIKNISPSEKVVHTLEKQMEAERSKRAEVTLAEADRQAQIKISEGRQQEMINLSEGEKQKRINEAEGKAKEIEILASAKAEGLRLVTDALASDGGAQAADMQLKEQFIEQVGKVIRHADVSVVPTQVAQLNGFFEGMETVTSTIKEGQ